ncbi:hypothetical protein DFS34DRAFT_691202 [Phlyctochytrium arcticum]|nr:hypothetical protein DFS34DRAFT_691202 [Phlyctochytrium arcticum]
MRTIDKIKQPIVLRPPKIMSATPCAVEVATLFNCWRAISVDSAQCVESARALTTCMASKGATKSSSNSVDEINLWLKKARSGKQV